MISSLHENDIKELLEIYNYYVVNTAVTFDVKPLSIDAFNDKVNRIKVDYPFLVYLENNEILGFAYGSRFRPKPAYDFVVESTVYVRYNAHGKQIGTKLYAELLQLLKQKKLHTVLGVLTIPNDASIKLHEKFGFKQVANLEEVGFKFGRWHNVGIWQLKLV